MMGYERLGYAGGHMAGGSLFGFGGLIFLFVAAALVTGLIIWLVASRKRHGTVANPGQYGPIRHCGDAVAEHPRTRPCVSPVIVSQRARSTPSSTHHRQRP